MKWKSTIWQSSKEQPSFQKDLPIPTLQCIHRIAFQILQQQLNIIQPNDIPIKKATHTRLNPMPFPLVSVIISNHRMRVSRIWPVLRPTLYKLCLSKWCSRSILPCPFSFPTYYPVYHQYNLQAGTPGLLIVPLHSMGAIFVAVCCHKNRLHRLWEATSTHMFWGESAKASVHNSKGTGTPALSL